MSSDYQPARFPGCEDPPAIQKPPLEFAAPMRVYSEDVVPEPPHFAVRDFILRSGFHFIWAQPSGGKTYTWLSAVHEMMLARRVMHQGYDRFLFNHPDLKIEWGWERVLWIATEESAGRLRYRGEKIRRGLDAEHQDFALEHFHVPGSGFNLLDLPAYIDRHGPFDAVMCDSLTGLRPRTINGRHIAHDVDNDAANELCLMLRHQTEKHEIPIFVFHHTGRETAKGYRGPTDYWASADVQIGMVPDETAEGLRWRIKAEKVRDGQKPESFLLKPTWTPEGTFTVQYDGDAKTALTDCQGAVMGFFRENAQASVADAINKVTFSENPVRKACTALEQRGLLLPAGKNIKGSQQYVVADGMEADS